MKQHKFGKKVQNWHRPLQPGQLKHRYAKEKHDDPFAAVEINAAQTSLTEFNRLQSLDRNAEFRDGELAIDDHWNFIYGNDDILAELSYSDLIDESDCSEYQMRQFIIEMCLPRSPLIPQSVATVPSAQVEAQTVQDEQAVELRLFRFLRAIAEFPRSRGTLRHLLENASYHPAEMNDVSHPADDSEHFALVRLFSPFWSKSPRGLPPPENASELMRQMFETDQVSSNYRVRWASFSEIPHFKWICWAIIIGSGASLKRAARFFGWRINDRFQYFLERTPMGSELPVRLRYVDDGYLAPLHAIIYAEVSRLGGTLVDFCRVCRRNAYLIDLTDPDVDSRFVQFWHSTVQWIINHRNAIDDEQSGEILDWALHEHIESQANRRAHFSWRGRTPQATLRRVAEYERSRSLPSLHDLHGGGLAACYFFSRIGVDRTRQLAFLAVAAQIQILAWVILENHLHWIAAGPKLSRRVGEFKSFTATSILKQMKVLGAKTLLQELEYYKLRHKVDQVHQLWQEGSHPQMIEAADVMRQKIEYIHNNPLRRGYVDDPVHWRYSSAPSYAGKVGSIDVCVDWQ